MSLTLRFCVLRVSLVRKRRARPAADRLEHLPVAGTDATSDAQSDARAESPRTVVSFQHRLCLSAFVSSRCSLATTTLANAGSYTDPSNERYSFCSTRYVYLFVSQ